MTTIRFAWGGSVAACANAFGRPHELGNPALLVSFVVLKEFEKQRHGYHMRDWVMDSGAFSAHNSGKVIDLSQYAETCSRMLGEDRELTEVFSLDVIGDWRASLRNCDEMWRRGIPAIPTYHVGEPEDVLRGIARDYPKIALGGAVGYADKNNWAEQCFLRVWPCKIHGLGFGAQTSILRVPWHSVDATNWVLQPQKFGLWKAYGKMSVRGAAVDVVRAQIDWYLRLEVAARHRWRRDLVQFERISRSGGVA